MPAKTPTNKSDHIWSYTVNAVYEIPAATAVKPYIIGGVGGLGRLLGATGEEEQNQGTFHETAVRLEAASVAVGKSANLLVPVAIGTMAAREEMPVFRDWHGH